MIRWIVVGAGSIGPAHLHALDAAPGAEVVGVVDPRFEDVSLQAGPHRRFARLDEALAATNPDAAVIAAPNHTHLDLGLQCVDAGVHVLCEKPVGRSSTEAHRLRQAAYSRGVRAGAVMNMRAQQHDRWVHEQIHSGQLRVRAVTVTGQIARLHGWHAGRDDVGGGLLRLIGIHFLDLARWWLGELDVVGASVHRTKGAATDDVAHAVLRSGEDVPVTLALSAIGTDSLAPVRIAIEGDGARVVLVGHEAVIVEGLPIPPPAEPSQPELPYGPGHLAVAREATEALAAGLDLPVPLDDAIRSIELVDRVHAAGVPNTSPTARQGKAAK